MAKVKHCSHCGAELKKGETNHADWCPKAKP